MGEKQNLKCRESEACVENVPNCHLLENLFLIDVSFFFFQEYDPMMQHAQL